MNLEKEISAFHKLLPSLRASHRTGWVVIVDEDCEGSFSSFEDAAAFAMKSYPSRDLLIRHTDEAMAQVPFVVVEH